MKPLTVQNRVSLHEAMPAVILIVLAFIVAGILYRIARTPKPPLQSERHNATRLVWVDGSGRISRAIEIRHRYIFPHITPDHKRVLLTRVMPGYAAIWSLSLRTGKPTPLVATRNRSAFAIISPDGAAFAFSEWREHLGWPFTAVFGDSKAARPLLRNAALEKLFNFTPDDWANRRNYIALTSRSSLEASLLIVRADDGKVYPLLKLPKQVRSFGARFSPDGKWIAFTSDISGRDEIYRAQLPSRLERLPLRTSDLVKVSESGGCSPEWGFNGEILFIAPGDHLIASNWSERSEAASGVRVLFHLSRIEIPPFKYRFGGYCVDRSRGALLMALDNVSGEYGPPDRAQ